LKREVDEELGLGISLVGVESIVSTKNVIPLPLPISIHKVIYEHRTRGSTEKQEYFFFARMTGEISTISNDEIQEFKWFESDEILAMEEDVEIHGFIQEILDQNLDLLSIVG
jgi:8-oxo-dGTP pyrophosphatase MutT (NUDIX family)